RLHPADVVAHDEKDVRSALLRSRLLLRLLLGRSWLLRGRSARKPECEHKSRCRKGCCREIEYAHGVSPIARRANAVITNVVGRIGHTTPPRHTIGFRQRL